MGTTVTKEQQDSLDTYQAAFDKAPFYDWEKDGVLQSDASDDQLYPFFYNFFTAFFFKPEKAKKELCETDAHYLSYTQDYGFGDYASKDMYSNTYNKWIWQCYIHIRRGYRVGIPYLQNKPHIVDGKDQMKPNLPPLRYRHQKSYLVNGVSYYPGTIVLVELMKRSAGKPLTNDACNFLFDQMVRNMSLSTVENEYKKFSAPYFEVFHILDGLQKDNPALRNKVGYPEEWNEDHSLSSNDIILQGFPTSDELSKIQKMWGTEGHMKCTFPTMWYRFKDNIIGDGSKVDVDYAQHMIGFPRLHEDFHSNDGAAVHFKGGLTSLHDKPSDELLASAWECIGRFGQENYHIEFSKKKRDEMHTWLVKDDHWQRMQSWLLKNEPEILFFYYTQWSQYEASHHIEYSSVIVFLIYRHVAKWMITPIGEEKVVRWKNSIQVELDKMPKWEWLAWLAVGETYERTDNMGKLMDRYIRDSEEQITDYTYGDDGKFVKYVFNVRRKTLQTYDEKGKPKTDVQFHEDGSKTLIGYDQKGKAKDPIQVDKDGKWTMPLDPSWKIPDSKIQLLNPNLYSTLVGSDVKKSSLRELWMESHMTLGGLKEGVDWVKHIPYYPNLPIPPNDITTLPPSEYIKYVYNFIKQHPLAMPTMPSIFSNPDGIYCTVEKMLIGEEESESIWTKACHKQWVFYLIWVEANVNACGQPDYVKPGDTFPKKNDKGQPVINQYPNTGILAPYDKNNSLVKVGHILTLGLTTIFGDAWWNELLNALKDTFDWVIQFFRDHLPEIGLGLLLVGAGILAFYGIAQFVGEEGRRLAS